MIRKITLITITLSILPSLSFSQEKKEIDYAKKFVIEQNEMFMRGMINFGDTMLVDETEVLIMEWLEYVFYQKLEDIPSFLKMTEPSIEEKAALIKYNPDSELLPVDPLSKELLLSVLQSQEENREVVKLHFAQKDYYFPTNKDSVKNGDSKERLEDKLRTPITGITYSQALSYCKWRTKIDSFRVNDKRYFVEKNSLENHRSYHYSLLSPSDYKMLIANRDSMSTNGKWGTFNYRDARPPKKAKLPISNKNYGNSLQSLGAYVYHKDKDEHLIDIQGNAAEMTSFKGVAKGGSFYHYAVEADMDSCIKYEKPEAWLGFRICAKREAGGRTIR